MLTSPFAFQQVEYAVLCSWAAKSILMGYGILPTPSNRFELFNNPTVSTWMRFPTELSHSDVTWVGYVGKFKSHWALLKPSEPPPRVSSCALVAPPAVAAAATASQIFFSFFLFLSLFLITSSVHLLFLTPCLPRVHLVIGSPPFRTIFFKTTLSVEHSILSIIIERTNITVAHIYSRCA